MEPIVKNRLCEAPTAHFRFFLNRSTSCFVVSVLPQGPVDTNWEFMCNKLFDGWNWYVCDSHALDSASVLVTGEDGQISNRIDTVWKVMGWNRRWGKPMTYKVYTCHRFSPEAQNRTRIGLLSSRIMWLSGISGQQTHALISPRGSTIKLPWVCTVTSRSSSWYDLWSC